MGKVEREDKIFEKLLGEEEKGMPFSPPAFGLP